ncbi:hypothetical protein BG004_007237 [Podila humilis]|nr:hypothetical protein BG004_007237 [Podila humilis]
MSLPRLLDPEDLVDVETPDERSIMTYISEYYLIMSKHQAEQDPAVAADLRAKRLQAKHERLALAGEDQEATRHRLREEEERRRREEQEELERIRLRRMEIEGWSIRAAERAKEEEEALRKRRQEEDDARLQRKLRREQREKEKGILRQQATAGGPSSLRSTSGSPRAESAFSESENDDSDLEPEIIDPKEQEQRQQELDEKLAEYHQGIAELSEWIRQQDSEIPHAPDTATSLDRARDLEPLTEAIKLVEEAQTVKEHLMSHLHDVREELLEFENPDLAPEQVSDMDKKWWELETLWTALSNKVVEAKDATEEIKWIIDCTQEIDRVNGEIKKFEAQLLAAADKRTQETIQDRSQKSALEQQDVNLSSISFLLKTYVDFLTSLMDPKVHHYDAPEYLTARNTDLTTVILPHLGVIIEKAQQNLASDRLLRSFLDAFVLSEAWIGESIEWLANIEVPTFVSQDVWMGANTVQQYLARDISQDLDLDYLESVVEELKMELEDEQGEVTTFRSSGFAKLDEQATAVMRSVKENEDPTVDKTTKAVQAMMSDVMNNLVKVESLLPKEGVHCEYATKVLKYLLAARAVLSELEAAFNTIQRWELKQPDNQVEAAVKQVEASHDALETTFQLDTTEPYVWESVQVRHCGLTTVVKDLRVSFHQKHDMIKVDRQMQAFLDATLVCQTTLHELRTRLGSEPPWTGFNTQGVTQIDDFITLVANVGVSIDAFENGVHVRYLASGEDVRLMAVNSNGRLDPAVVRAKLDGVASLLKDVRALRSDRECAVQTVSECRNLSKSFQALQTKFTALETELSSILALEPDQVILLTELCEKSNEFRDRDVALKQESTYRYLAKDPSCSEVLAGIKTSQTNIERDIARLQSNLETKEQWDFAWNRFSDRVVTLQEYLQSAEQEMFGRQYISTNFMCDDEAVWKKDEAKVQEISEANSQTLLNLNEFERVRLNELTASFTALLECAEIAGGADSLDPIRKAQYNVSEQQQSAIADYLTRLFAWQEDEKRQVDLLKKRLDWFLVQFNAKSELEVSFQSCQDAIKEYSNQIQKCEESGDLSEFNLRFAEQMQSRVQHLATMAAAKKMARQDAALEIFSALEQQASVSNRLVPTNLKKELADFKEQYNLLDSHLSFAHDLALHATRIASFLEKAETVDSDLIKAATDLKADKEASPVSIANSGQARAAYSALASELRSTLESPIPAEDVSQHYTTLIKDYQRHLEGLLCARLSEIAVLDQALEPLLHDFHELLGYQENLRSLVIELDGHNRWVDDVQKRMADLNKFISDLYSSWPDQGAQAEDQGYSVRQDLSSDRNAQAADLEHLTVLVRTKKQEFATDREKIVLTLKGATSHSRQLQEALERSMDVIGEKIERVESDMRFKSNQLRNFHCTISWENMIHLARQSIYDTSSVISSFAHNDARWCQGSSDFKRSSLDQDQVARLKSTVNLFEAQIKHIEGETKPAVDCSWAELCSSLADVSRPVPHVFQRQQTEFEQQITFLRSQLAYSHDVIAQHETLSAISAQLVNLAGLQQHLKILADSPALVTDASQGMTLANLSTQIRSVAQDLTTDFGLIHFPVDESSEDSRIRAQESNTAIRGFIQESQRLVERAVTLVEDTELKRALSLILQELETTLQQQNKTIADKNCDLERVLALITCADGTAEDAADVLTKYQPSDNSVVKDIESSEQKLSNSSDQLVSGSISVTHDLSTTATSLTTLSMSKSAPSSVATLTPTFPSASFGLSKQYPLTLIPACHSAEELESLISHVEDLRLEVKEMTERKTIVQNEVMQKSTASLDIEQQVSQLDVHSASSSRTGIRLIHDDAFADMLQSFEKNRTILSNLDNDISKFFDIFDSKTGELLKQLAHQDKLLVGALKERQQADIEKAIQEEADRVRQQKALDKHVFERSMEHFMAWTKGHRESLIELWKSHGYFARQAGSNKDDVMSLERETVRCKNIVLDQVSMYKDLRTKMAVAFKDTGCDKELAEHSERIDGAWTLVQRESDGYHALLRHLNAWAELNSDISNFEKDGLVTLEKRVEALRWMPWELFQQEEKKLSGFIDQVEAQVGTLQIDASRIQAIESAVELLDIHKSILEANNKFFEQRMAGFPARLQVARSHVEIIHETTKEIALHAKFHADLVRIETAIAQQIDTVKARLGSLERSSCFALSSHALEAVVTAANVVSVDAKYQFSVLQEVEYSALEQTAFDLDMVESHVMTIDGELTQSGDEGSRASRKTSVHVSMERIRLSLISLEGYIEEDCFETLLAAEFYTHTKATEDIRQWIGACRESMTQLNAIEFGCHGMEGAMAKDVRKQAMEARSRHIGGLEKKLHQFGPTIQNYDTLSGDFFLLRHPASSDMNLNLPEACLEHREEPRDSMRTILRQTVQERTKRTREDWELLKQEFMAKVNALEDLRAQHEKEEGKNYGADMSHGNDLDTVRRGSISKSKTIKRFGSDILEDIARVTHEIEVMIEHGSLSLIENLDSLAHDVEQNLEVVSNMVDRLNDWRLIEKHGAAVEQWQKVKMQALAKRQEMNQEGYWSRRSSMETSFEDRGSLGIHPLEGNSSRSNVMQPTTSSHNRVKAILGSPADPIPSYRRKKRFSAGNIMNGGTFSPPSPKADNSGSNVSKYNTAKAPARTKGSSGRVRSGTAPGLEATMGGHLDLTKKSSHLGSPSLQALSSTFSAEAKRRPPIMRKNDSNTSISSIASAQMPDISSHLLSPSLRPQRTVYKADPNSSLDVEVARVVNASGFVMKVQKLRDGQQAHLKVSSNNNSMTRLRSSSTVNLAVESDGNANEYTSGMDSATSSPRQIKAIRGQGRISMSGGSSPGRHSGDDNSSGEVGRYVFGDIEPKVCYCRILRSRKVMVRVGGGWCELSKFMEDHASLEQRKAKGRLSASNSAVSIASTNTNQGGMFSDSRSAGEGGSSDSLPESVRSNNGERGGGRLRSNTDAPKRKEFIYHVRPSDDLSLKTIKFTKNGAGESLVST